MSAQKLKPISWREWAGEIERDGGARNPYLSLEERYGFWDIRVSFGSTWMRVLPVSCRNYIWMWIYNDVLILRDINRCFGLGISEANIWEQKYRLSERSLQTGFAVRMCRSRSDG